LDFRKNLLLVFSEVGLEQSFLTNHCSVEDCFRTGFVLDSEMGFERQLVDFHKSLELDGPRSHRGPGFLFLEEHCNYFLLQKLDLGESRTNPELDELRLLQNYQQGQPVVIRKSLEQVWQKLLLQLVVQHPGRIQL
jgi:hypothetical protein